MDNLIKEKTKNTFGVNFQTNGNLELVGSSFPENASEFFSPLIKWLNQYCLEITGKITFAFRFDYLNSSSIKFISEIIDAMEAYHKSGGAVEGNWYYDENDEDIMEMGEELKEDVSFSFNIIMK